MVDSGLTFTPRFEKAMRTIWSPTHEGQADKFDPDDPGGRTYYGIAQKFNPDFDWINPTPEKAKAQFWKKYWALTRFEEIEEECLAIRLFDNGIVIGIPTAIKLLQQILNFYWSTDFSPAEDGVCGSKTLAAVNLLDGNMVEALWQSACAIHYISRKKEKYIKGWLLRLFDTHEY